MQTWREACKNTHTATSSSGTGVNTRPSTHRFTSHLAAPASTTSHHLSSLTFPTTPVISFQTINPFSLSGPIKLFFTVSLIISLPETLYSTDLLANQHYHPCLLPCPTLLLTLFPYHFHSFVFLPHFSLSTSFSLFVFLSPSLIPLLSLPCQSLANVSPPSHTCRQHVVPMSL